ncbi:hypothetical protein AB6A40_010879 [Gnathostoma spinigerum]|uniref:Potassium channel domain-containing protein n=1 Tax=Gnathostoma spinigerum TaxID=75299 RepID=A0ABD6EW56_9BILA
MFEHIYRLNTCKFIAHKYFSRSRDILVWYESQLRSVVSPVGMEWDMWGSLFFVSTIFTTIGYGNIYPRTNGGKALSMVYAIIGIPLVLAILNQFGTTLTRLVSSLWMRYRECVKAFADRKRRSAQRRAKRLISKDYGKRYDKSDADAEKMEEGRIIFRPTVNGKSKIYHDDPAEYFEFGPNGEIIESR